MLKEVEFNTKFRSQNEALIS